MIENLSSGRFRERARQPTPLAKLSRGEMPELPTRAPTVSVIIPCFNYGHFLRDCVESVVHQRGVRVEVTIVDDASTDGSAEVAQELVGHYPQVQLIRNPRNIGHVKTFNRGWAVASGEFVVRLDADDMLTPDSLSRATALFDAHANVGLVYGNPLHFETPHPPSPRTTLDGWTIWSGSDWVAHRCRKAVNCITTPEAMIRADVMREVGGLRTELKFAQDMEMWLRVAAVSDVGHVDGPDQAFHRDHPASMSATVGSGLLTDLQERRRVFELLFDGPGGKLADAGRMQRAWRRALAIEALDSACRTYDRGRVVPQDVDDLVAFALSTYPDAGQLREFHALNHRKVVGNSLSQFVPSYFFSAVRRRLVLELAHRTWSRTGL